MYDQDQLQRALELDSDSGKFELDENGYTRFIPSDDELTAINQWLSMEHDIAEEEYVPIYQDAADNLETYKTSKTQDIIEGEPAILPAPVARIAVDQVVAWMFNTIMRPSPVISIQPSFSDDYQISVPADPNADPRLREMGLQSAVPITRTIPAEDMAFYLERGYDHKLNQSLQFSSVLRDVILDACTVERGYAKVCWEYSDHTVFRPKVNGIFIDTSTREEIYESDPDGVRWYSIPVFNMLKRVHEDDLDRAEWLSERTPISPEEFRGRCLTDQYPLIDENDIEMCCRSTSEVKPQQQLNVESTTQNRRSYVPRNMLDVRLVWFYRWLKFNEEYTDEATGELKRRRVVRRISLYGDYHHGARKICSIYRNYRNDQLRPYAVCYQLKDAHSDSGSSTTSVSKWFQKAITYCFQSEFKSSFAANVMGIWYDPDSRAASHFNKDFKFRPGMAIPGKEGEEWGVVRAGAEHYPLFQLINELRGMAREAQNMSVYESGDNVPSRTPSSTISQILQQGLQQPIFFLRNINEFVARLVRLDLETRRQFQPMGEVIPTQNRETKETINIPFRFPTGDIARNLTISLTAANEAMAREHEPEQLMMLLNLWQQGAQFVAQVAGPLTNAEATPAQRELFVQIVVGWQALFDRVITMTRTDKEKFNLQTAVEALKAEAEAAVQEMMNAAAANQANPGQVQPGLNGQPTNGTGQPGVVAEPDIPVGNIETPPTGTQESTFIQ